MECRGVSCGVGTVNAVGMALTRDPCRLTREGLVPSDWKLCMVAQMEPPLKALLALKSGRELSPNPQRHLLCVMS